MGSLRYFATTVLVVSAFFGQAQGTLTTYYTVPPTNGCDGLWAFGPASAIWDSCSGPFTYSTDPWGCAQDQGGNFTPFWLVGDTAFSILCSLPCNMEVWSADGLCSVALCGLPTSILPTQATALGRAFPNPLGSEDGVLNIDLRATAVSSLQVLDLAGRTLRTERVKPSIAVLDLHGLPSGTYLLEHFAASTCVRTERIVIQ